MEQLDDATIDGLTTLIERDETLSQQAILRLKNIQFLLGALQLCSELKASAFGLQ